MSHVIDVAPSRRAVSLRMVALAVVAAIVLTSFIVSPAEAAAGGKAFRAAPRPAVSGTAVVGQNLTVKPGTWSPQADLRYQWLRNGRPISGARSKSYKIVAADAGKKVAVTVTGSRSGYVKTSRTSAARSVKKAAFSSVPTPVISGQPVFGARLTAQPGAWSPKPTFSYQWKRNGRAISGARASTYTVVSADLGAHITVTVTGSRAGYVTTSKTSGSKLGGNAAFATVPTPKVTGSPVMGAVLSAEPGAWAPAATFAYQWKRNGAAIPGAVQRTYALAAADVGKTISVTVVGSRAGYATASRTSATLMVKAAAFRTAPTPTITGTAAVGDILSVNPGTWSPTATLTYQWRRNGVDIPGATATRLTLGPADSDALISVAVTGTREGYAPAARVSAAVRVAKLPESPVTTVTRVSGEITHNTSWTPTVPTTYILDGDVTIASGATLDVGPHATIASLGGSLTVEGTLTAIGTAQDAVTFTSTLDPRAGVLPTERAAPPAAGDWAGLRVAPGGSFTASHVEVRFATTGITGEQPRVLDLSDAIVADLSGSGVDLAPHTEPGKTTAVRIEDVSVDRCGDAGIWLHADGEYYGPGPTYSPVVRDNSVVGCENEAIVVANGELRGGNLTGNMGHGNGLDLIALSGTLVSDTVFPLGQLPVGVYAKGVESAGLGVDRGVTLDIMPGTTVRALNAQISVDGELWAVAPPDQPITFTSLRDGASVPGEAGVAPGASDWWGMTAADGAVLVMDGVRVRYARTGIASGWAERFEVRHSSISDAQWTGIAVDSAAYNEDATIVIEDNVVQRVGGVGIAVGNLYDEAGGPSADYTSPTVRRNRVTDSFLAMQIFGYNLDGAKLVDNVGTNNEINLMSIAGRLEGDTTFPLGPLDVSLGAIPDHGRSLEVRPHVTLTIREGTVIPSINGGLVVHGTLLIEGTSDEPVFFTSLYDQDAGRYVDTEGNWRDPAAGDWNGIGVNRGGVLEASHLHMKYASLGATEPQWFQVADSRIEFDAARCVRVEDAPADAFFSGSVLGCDIGVESIRTRTSGTFDARGVQWGSNLPPGVRGNPRVVGDVDYLPWAGTRYEPGVEGTDVRPVPAPGSCADYVFIGVRGSGEPAGLGLIQHVVLGFAERLAAAEPTSTIDVIALSYPAHPVPFNNPDADSLGDVAVDILRYVPGAEVGVTVLNAQIGRVLDECGADQKIVLAGYSQGAWVIHATLSVLTVLSSTAVDNIRGVAYLADPLRRADLDIPDVLADQEGNGVAATVIGQELLEDSIMANWSLSSGLVDRSVQRCAFGDLVCAPQLSVHSWGEAAAIHTGYPIGDRRLLGRELADVVLSR